MILSMYKLFWRATQKTKTYFLISLKYVIMGRKDRRGGNDNGKGENEQCKDWL